MQDFDYVAPTDLREAVQILSGKNGNARPLCGGTDLIDHVRTGRVEPNLIVDIKKIAELNILEIGAAGLRLGAAVPCYKIYTNREISTRYAALADSCHIIGGIQIQSRASMGGNICNSGPAADTIPSIIALGGICVIVGPEGTREIPSEAFCTGPGKNVLQPGELLVEFRFPPRPAKSGSHYRRFIPRNEMDIAVVGVGASVALDNDSETITAARVALAAVAPTPLRVTAAEAALVGQPATDETFAKVAKVAQEAALPITDMRGTTEYRLHLTEVLTRRVLRTAIARARGEETRYQPGH